MKILIPLKKFLNFDTCDIIIYQSLSTITATKINYERFRNPRQCFIYLSLILFLLEVNPIQTYIHMLCYLPLPQTLKHKPNPNIFQIYVLPGL